jgi:hypothetical protein
MLFSYIESLGSGFRNRTIYRKFTGGAWILFVHLFFVGRTNNYLGGNNA